MAAHKLTFRQRMELDKFFMLLMALIALLVIVPIIDDDEWGAPVLGIITMVTLVLALRTLAHQRATLIFATTLGIIAYLISTGSYFMGASPLLALPFQLAFYGFVNLSIMRDVLIDERVNADTICGGICVYLLLGLNWAIIFAGVELIHPGSLRATNTFYPNGVDSPMDFVYFSYVTLTTLGYGDIIPVSNAARSATIGCSVSGVLFIAVFIGRLVGLSSSKSYAKHHEHH